MRSGNCPCGLAHWKMFTLALPHKGYQEGRFCSGCWRKFSTWTLAVLFLPSWGIEGHKIVQSKIWRIIVLANLLICWYCRSTCLHSWTRAFQNSPLLSFGVVSIVQCLGTMLGLGKSLQDDGVLQRAHFWRFVRYGLTIYFLICQVVEFKDHALNTVEQYHAISTHDFLDLCFLFVRSLVFKIIASCLEKGSYVPHLQGL